MNRTCFASGTLLTAAALFATIGLALTLPSTADAQLGTLFRSDVDVYGCAQFEFCDQAGDPCDGGRTCTLLPAGNLGCVFTDGTFIFDLLCCDPDASTGSQCGSLNGIPGVCTGALNDANEGFCIYEPEDLFCNDPASVGLSDVEDCMTPTVSGDIYSDFVNGDCDDDGLPNHVDPCHCDSDDSCVADDPDAGPSPENPAISFTGKGGCTPTPFAPPSPLLYLLTLPPLLLLRRRSLSPL